MNKVYITLELQYVFQVLDAYSHFDYHSCSILILFRSLVSVNLLKYFLVVFFCWGQSFSKSIMVRVIFLKINKLYKYEQQRQLCVRNNFF